MDFPEEESHNQSESDSQLSDDSQNDPNFDVVEETLLSLSNLSLKRKSKRAKISDVKEMDDKEEVEELNETDQKSYDIIQKMIEGGQEDKLKVDQCKIYLRKHGLRLSGKKDELILRIKEHVDIVNGGGETKYPASSFVLNCKGDSCKGDVVMFEQKVYEEFSIISRSSNGGPSGTRIVAGRILKESYGAAKQQHTFTIEVLWSKGEKPLPPLYPMLIKGRNLYRLNTMRQRWEDEGERRRILLEKHARGGAARSNRDARIQEKEKQKMQRVTKKEHPKRKQEKGRREPLPFISVKPDEHINHLQQQQQRDAHCYAKTQELNIPIQPVNLFGNLNFMQNAHAEGRREPLPLISVKPDEHINHLQQQQQRDAHCYAKTQELNIPIQPVNLFGNPNFTQNAHAVHQRQPLVAMNCNFQNAQHTGLRPNNLQFPKSPTSGSFHEEPHLNYPLRNPTMGHPQPQRPQGCTYKENQEARYSQPNHAFHMQNMNAGGNRPIYQQGNEQRQNHAFHMQNMNAGGNRPIYQQGNEQRQNHAFHMQNMNAGGNRPIYQQGNVQRQKCPYFDQGRCHYGDRCKFLH